MPRATRKADSENPVTAKVETAAIPITSPVEVDPTTSMSSNVPKASSSKAIKDDVPKFRKPRAVRSASASTAASDSPSVELQKKPRATRKGKEKAAPSVTAVIEVKDEEGEDDDEPVFVGQAKAKQLSERFSFQKASPIGSGSTAALAVPPKEEKKAPRKRQVKKAEDTATIKATIQARLAKKEEDAANLILYPPKEPEPMPSWLGKSATLLALVSCPVCHQWWKRESGSARWRHISTCLPPLFRPPNPGPDLQKLVGEALEAVHAPDAPTSLMDLHVQAGDVQDRRVADPSEVVKPKTKASLGTGWRRVTRVRSASERNAEWEEEVSERVSALTEASPTKRRKRESTPETSSISLLRAPSSPISSSLPGTQPLGESSLAALYTRARSPSPADIPTTPPLMLSQRHRSRERSPTPNHSPIPQNVISRSPSPSSNDIHSPASLSTDPTLPIQSQSPHSPPQSSPSSPPIPDQENVGAPPPSQKRSGRFVLEALSPASQRLLGLAEPFRGRGSLHVDGGFPGKRGSTELGPGGAGAGWGGKKARVGGGVIGTWG